MDEPKERRAKRGTEMIRKRILASGAIAFYAKFTDSDGRRKHVRVGATLEEARRNFRAIQARIDAGRLGVELPTAEEKAKRSATVGELVETFISKYARPGLKDPEAYRRSARSKLKRRIKPLIGDRVAASLTLGDIERFRDALAAKPYELQPASITRTLAVLSRAFNWARRAGEIVCANPVQGVERPRAASSLDFLSRQEVAALLAHAEDFARLGVASHVGLMLFPMVTTAVYTGLRLGELHGLTWSAVRFEAKQLDVVRSYASTPKSGEARHLPLHAEVDVVLRAWQKLCPATDDDLVFPVEGRNGFRMATAGSLRGALPALLVVAGCHVPSKPFHALRHTFASHAVMSGVPLYTLQRLLGHSTPMMTQRYSHLAPDHLAAEVARVSFHVPVAGVADLGEQRRREQAAREAG